MFQVLPLHLQLKNRVEKINRKKCFVEIFPFLDPKFYFV